ncbi:MerR family transcriptional regulator [Streptomyces antioxidans]|uniref:MerR family transcriptional regulator n=1 Tax=Streptomyces antioxidans TaxID=1507734 RepID=A0A1V4CZB6_9ACTN|nr:MerR family transcriptional regulator [Streptomyces antioxidans]OPF74559.1 MerR family transcriptional regulator [Streptomyces antioxidans]
MRIGELAAKTGVSVRALRYYEEQHLLTSDRSPSGQRHYADTAVDRVLWIQCLYSAGLSSKTIREFLPCAYTGVATPATIARLTAERDRINAQMANLATTRDHLEVLIEAANGTVEGEANCLPQTA